MTDATIANKLYPLQHPLVQFNTELFALNGCLYVLPKSWGDFKPFEIAQQVILTIQKTLNASNPKDNEAYFTELGEYITQMSSFIASGVAFSQDVVVADSNKDFYNLWVQALRVINSAAAALAYLKLEDSASYNMEWFLHKAIQLLEIFSNWLYQFVIVSSVDEDGRLSNKVELWPQDKINELNV